jgi:Fe-S oxidoreductase
VLEEMLRGEVIGGGWRSTEVRDALDLCLSCKACKTECPAGVDMAAYKADFLANHYRGRRRPVSHYSMGWLPLWARAASRAPGVVNRLAAAPGLGRVLKRAAGVDVRRPIPRLAPETFRAWAGRRPNAPAGVTRRGDVLLWPDTFTDHFWPERGTAAVDVLQQAGFGVRLPEKQLCCGLTWISTGQLGMARRVLARTIRALRGPLGEGLPVVGLEPSCTSVLRSDAVELFPEDENARRLAGNTFTFAELVQQRAPDWQVPVVAADAVVQAHCHQRAVLGMTDDMALLARLGVQGDLLDSGCCGMAGNFGFEEGHYDISVACGERVLMPAVRRAPSETLVVADGFSCRLQIEHATGRRARHLAEVAQLASRP